MPSATIELDRPHPGQQRVLDGAARFNVLQCGRRFGKTKLGTHLLIDGGLRGWPVAWFAPTYKLLAEVWREALDILAPLKPKVNSQEKRIGLPTRGVLDFWSLDDADPARGRKYKRAVVDEAGIARNLQSAWQNAIRPTLTDLQGEAWFLGTPKGRNFFNRLFARGESGNDPDWRAWRLPTVTNPYIDPAEVEAARRDMPPAAFDQEFMGIPADDGGNPFGMDAIAACAREGLADGPVAAFGLDLAKKRDWSVLCGLNDAGGCCHLDRWQGDWRQTIRKVIDNVGDAPCLLDSTGVGDPILEMLQAEGGGNFEGYVFSKPSKQRLMEGLAAGLQRHEITYPEGWLRSELETFEYEYTAGGVHYTCPEGLTDDGVMALALARERLSSFVRLDFGGGRMSVCPM